MSSPINVSYVTPKAVTAVSVIFPLLSILFIGLRMYVRRIQKARYLADDWLLIPAMILVIGMGVALIIGVEGKGIGYGKGLPPGSPPEAQFTYLSPEIILTEKVQFYVQLMNIVSLGLIKLSFIMFYRRIFCTGARTWFSISTVIMGGLIVAWTITFFFVFVFYCGTHPEKEWSTVLDIVTFCPNALDDQMALGISDSIMDVVIIAMPIPVILGLQLNTSKKMLIVGVFLLGGFAVAASMVRMGIFIKVSLVGFNPNLDGDKDIALILFWSMIESGTGIIAACLPTLKIVFSQSTIEKFLNSVKSTFSLRSRSTQNSYPEVHDVRERSSEGSSVVHIAQFGGVSSVESYAMKDTDYLSDTKAHNGEIRLQNTFQQQESFV